MANWAFLRIEFPCEGMDLLVSKVTDIRFISRVTGIFSCPVFGYSPRILLGLQLVHGGPPASIIRQIMKNKFDNQMTFSK